MNIQEIMQFLPHRYPFLLVDRVLEVEPGKSILAIKNVTINEPFFTGHFPVKAVMPGVLMVEALAQAAAILAYRSIEKREETLFYLGGIEKTRFRKIVTPGDQLQLKIDVTMRRKFIWKFTGQALVDGEVACSTEMTSSEGKV